MIFRKNEISDGIKRCTFARTYERKNKYGINKWRWNEIMRTLEELEKEEKDRQEFIEATNKLERELKRTWPCKIMIRLLDWLAEKI